MQEMMEILVLTGILLACLLACRYLYAGKEGNAAINRGNEVNTALWRSDAKNGVNDSTVASLKRSATEA